MSHPAQTVHDTYDICTLALEVLTPLHIGGREGALKSLDFVFDAGTVHVVDEDRFAQWLQAQGIVDLFVEEAKTGTMDLKRFIQKRPGWRQALPTWTRYTIKGGRDGMQEFRPLIRDAHDRVYLPGSAVKGALRTAILWKRLHEGTPVPLEQVEAAVERGIVKDRASGGWRWLQVANPENPGQKKPVGKERFSRWLQEAVLGNDPHHDLLRCLTVRDAYPIDDSLTTKVIPLVVLCKQHDGTITPSSQDIVLWVEAIMPGSRFRMVLQWDRRQRVRPEWKPGPPNGQAPASLDDVLACVAAHERFVVQAERAFFADSHGGIPQAPEAARHLAAWYADAEGVPLMRLGFGSGMMATTVNSLLDESLRQRIRNAAGHERGEDPAPKSRRVWIGPDGRVYPVGWVHVVPVDSAVHTFTQAHAERETDSVRRLSATTMGPPSSSLAAVVVRWTNATCVWNAGQCVIEAIHNTDRASSPRLATEEERRRWLAGLPDHVQRRFLHKRRTIVLDVDVEVEGNKKTIKAIHIPNTP